MTGTSLIVEWPRFQVPKLRQATTEKQNSYKKYFNTFLPYIILMRKAILAETSKKKQM